MTELELQQKFLDVIKDKVPEHQSFVDELASTLQISTDSAYRRLRGQTNLSFGEIQKLSTSFGISLDALFANSSETVSFNYRCLDSERFNVVQYLQSILGNLQTINRFSTKELIYSAKDIPIFHLFVIPEIAAYKLYFWTRNILRFDDYKDQDFSLDVVPIEIMDLAAKIYDEYSHTPSTEIWSSETVNVTLKQIEFGWQSGLIKSQEQVLSLYDKMHELLDFLYHIASNGYKSGLKDNDHRGDFNMYNNEVTIADNTIFFMMENTKVVHINHSVLNILTTTNPAFCDKTHEMIDHIISNSTPISKVNEKGRSIFFKEMHNKVDLLKANV